jgi:hypothetical protein
LLLNQFRQVEALVNEDGLILQLQLIVQHVGQSELVEFWASVDHDLLLGISRLDLELTEINCVVFFVVFLSLCVHVESEGCLVLEIRNDLDVALQLEADQLADVETQASTCLALAVSWLERAIRLEKPVVIFNGYARAFVDHTDLQDALISKVVRFHFDDAVAFREFDRVWDQIVKHLQDSLMVWLEAGRQVVGWEELELDSLRVALHFVYLEYLVDAVSKFERLYGNVEATALDVADVLQVLDVE